MSQESVIKKTEEEKIPKKRFFQVDLMKSLMILLVIVDHSTTHGLLQPLGSHYGSELQFHYSW